MNDATDLIASKLYMAYRSAAGGESLSVPGRELGTWEEMPDDVRYVWRSVARAAMQLQQRGDIK